MNKKLEENSDYSCFHGTAHDCIRMVPKLLQDCITSSSVDTEKLGTSVHPDKDILNK